MRAEQPQPSELVRAIYLDHLEHFGEPGASIRFGDGTVREGQEHFPPLIDVMIWRADESLDITTFATFGMAERPMDGAEHRAELHFAIRQTSLSEDDPGSIPLFSAGMSALLHPRFVEEGWDSTTVENQEVRYLNVVPITEAERQLKNETGLDALLDHWSDHAIDLFSPR